MFFIFIILIITYIVLTCRYGNGKLINLSFIYAPKLDWVINFHDENLCNSKKNNWTYKINNEFTLFVNDYMIKLITNNNTEYVILTRWSYAITNINIHKKIAEIWYYENKDAIKRSIPTNEKEN